MDYKDLRSIQESYTAMYSEEVVDEGLADMVDKATKAGQSGLEKMGVKINRTSRPTARPSVRTQDTMRKNQSSMEEVDVFDIIKGHLIDEGFADTEEAALAIMTNMSEDWKQSIVEGPVGEFADGVARTAGTVVGGAERVIKKGPGYLKQKLDNVKSTFDSARERTRENIPPNATKKPAAKSTPRPTPGGRMVKGNSTGPSAQSAVKRGGQSQHMGRDVPGADGPIRR